MNNGKNGQAVGSEIIVNGKGIKLTVKETALYTQLKTHAESRAFTDPNLGEFWSVYLPNVDLTGVGGQKSAAGVYSSLKKKGLYIEDSDPESKGCFGYVAFQEDDDGTKKTETTPVVAAIPVVPKEEIKSLADLHTLGAEFADGTDFIIATTRDGAKWASFGKGNNRFKRVMVAESELVKPVPQQKTPRENLIDALQGLIAQVPEHGKGQVPDSFCTALSNLMWDSDMCWGHSADLFIIHQSCRCANTPLVKLALELLRDRIIAE